jgi:Co/Zn/Cd efflux system component
MHRHAAESAATGRRLAVTLVLVAAYMVAEVVGGLVSNSLALLADAGHMLSDTAALGWSIAPGRDALSGLVIVGDCDRPSDVLSAVYGVLRERFDIDHVTIQIEPPGFVEPRQTP